MPHVKFDPEMVTQFVPFVTKETNSLVLLVRLLVLFLVCRLIKQGKTVKEE